MPKIPTYDSLQVAPDALPGPRMTSGGSAEFFGSAGREASQIGQGLSNLGATVSDISIKIQEQNNLEKVQAAQAAYTERMLAWTQQTKEQRQGHKAQGITREFEEWSTKTSSELSGALENESQRRAFSNVVRKSALAGKQEVGTFEFGEKKKAGLAAYNAANTNAVNAAAVAATPELLGLQRDTIISSVAAQSAMQGWGVEETEAEKGKWLTAMHVQRISNMVGSNADAARAYYTANQNEINGSVRDEVDKLLKSGEVKDGSLKLQFELQQLPGLSAQTKELDKRFKEGKISAEMRDATLTRLEHVEARRKSQQTEWEGNLLGAAADFKLKNPGKTILDLPPQIYNGLKNSGKLHQAMGLFSGEVKSNPETLLDLHEMARTQPEKFRSTNLKQYIGVLSTAHLKELDEMKKDPSKLQSASTLSEQLADMHDQMNWGTGDRKKKGQFDKAVRDEVQAEQTRTGKVLTHDERKKIIERMVIKGKRGWFFSDQYFEVRGTEKEKTFTPEIPDQDKADIKSAFFSRNKRYPTEEELLSAYRKWKGL